MISKVFKTKKGELILKKEFSKSYQDHSIVYICSSNGKSFKIEVPFRSLEWRDDHFNCVDESRAGLIIDGFNEARE